MIPDITVFWVIFFVLVLTIVLDRLLFKPILRTIAAREEAIRSAKELAERSAVEARAASGDGITRAIAGTRICSTSRMVTICRTITPSARVWWKRC